MSVSATVLADVEQVFEGNFSRQLELGASVSVWWRGKEILNRAAGFRDREKSQVWNEETLVPVYSATKGPASASLLLALYRHGLDENTPVGEVWSGFPLPAATFAEMMSHQCGLAALAQPASIWDHDAVVRAVERQLPAWSPGQGIGYHPRTFGFLLDEFVRRLTGMPLGQWWRRELAEPMGWDFWIGLPENQWHRVAQLVPGRAEKDHADQAFYRDYMSEGTMTRRAFLSPSGLHAVQDMNTPQAWSAGFAAMGGVGTARSLAQFYQAAIGAFDSPLGAGICRALATLQIQGEDRVLLRTLAFTCGCQQDPLDGEGKKSRALYGPNPGAFGHPGAGGSHAFADPLTGLSFSYVMNQMTLSVMPGPRSNDMVSALYRD